MEIVNRKAKFEYHFLQTYEAGMLLTGTEVKSLRAGDANLSDAWCLFDGGELYVKSMYIAPYKFGPQNQHEPRRTRKLLLKRSELKKLERKSTEKGLSIIPYKIYFGETGFAKCEIALAKGKKAYDKRDSIKERDVKRDLDRRMSR
jgi:SsrA-binding protein